jgi:hypothetical protein
MKKLIFPLLIVTALSGAATQAAEEVPKRLNFDRYSGMVENSPFAIATAVVAAAATPNFAKDLYLSSAAKSPDGDMLTILSSADKNFRKYLTTREPVDGYAIASIEWSERVGETKATISKDGQFATIGFNQALISTPGSNPGMMQPPSAKEVGVPPPVMAPVTAPNPVAQPVPMPIKPSAQPNAQVVPQPNPHVRGVIKRNPTGKQPMPAQPNANAKPMDTDE